MMFTLLCRFPAILAARHPPVGINPIKFRILLECFGLFFQLAFRELAADSAIIQDFDRLIAATHSIGNDLPDASPGANWTRIRPL